MIRPLGCGNHRASHNRQHQHHRHSIENSEAQVHFDLPSFWPDFPARADEINSCLKTA
jgi:hypothetical protein